MPTAADVSAFLGQGDSPQAVALAEQALPIITAMARAYTRGNGFAGAEVEPDIEAVLVTATARLMANPEQLRYSVGDVRFDSAFQGWTLPEAFVLNRYRKRAL